MMIIRRKPAANPKNLSTTAMAAPIGATGQTTLAQANAGPNIIKSNSRPHPQTGNELMHTEKPTLDRAQCSICNHSAFRTTRHGINRDGDRTNLYYCPRCQVELCHVTPTISDRHEQYSWLAS